MQQHVYKAPTVLVADDNVILLDQDLLLCIQTQVETLPKVQHLERALSRMERHDGAAAAVQTWQAAVAH